ncbi:YppG family protein [Ornithinibacillus salinisoli]|uniref:YppG family protein n=1 Tax=Ornithinibacillus salinisoli TaxID=1848459 RepID=A0ABW4VW69_9BACI
MNNRPFYNHPPPYYERYANFQYQPQPQQQPQQSYNPYHQQTESFYSQTPFEHFAKPKQPTNWYQEMYQNPDSYNQQYTNPSNGFLSQFQDEKGQMNLDKMLSTVGQMANTYHQVQPIIKQFGNFMKTFR